ncbi:glycosyltransferase family 2 protein [Edwardsiella piscicida]|uniref:glycosyltransferase family 2 protein n=1 Tax=Edwardsiella piscicida TaxID=1263550 RepID=UPI00247886B4|nr:glycosyltransferase family A protein [Edwardsiella piscicida]ELM3735777.1 glycosyltransferase family 2 protein [Edwardsiella piscicida]WGS78151.1 glycosyltransferase family A protein [Edwardsiella piscicida]WGS81538.1 glycosyltransferase family A protein [Edwardsiella piscicida]
MPPLSRLKGKSFSWIINKVISIIVENIKIFYFRWRRVIHEKNIYRCRDEYHFDRSSLTKVRGAGISGIMRLYNEERYLESSIESYIEQLDELIIVHNRCTDSTPEICEKMRLKYPHKIKVFHYIPSVAPPGSLAHVALDPRDERSLVNYYNFALSKTTKEYVMKVDGDCILIADAFLKIREYILSKKPSDEYNYFFGINLKYNDMGELALRKSAPLTAGYDHGIFKVSKNTFFKHAYNYEVFSHKLKEKNNGIVFFHLKSLKEDLAVDSHGLDTEFYRGYFNDRLSQDVIEWDDFPQIRGIHRPDHIKSL